MVLAAASIVSLAVFDTARLCLNKPCSYLLNDVILLLLSRRIHFDSVDPRYPLHGESRSCNLYFAILLFLTSIILLHLSNSLATLLRPSQHHHRYCAGARSSFWCSHTAAFLSFPLGLTKRHRLRETRDVRMPKLGTKVPLPLLGFWYYIHSLPPSLAIC